MTVLYILLALLIFGLLIFIHEFGHFIAAKCCGVQINEFAIGMGPKLWSKVSKKSNTRYSIRAFPIGGYVSMAGENGETIEKADGKQDEEIEPVDESKWFSNKKVWQRLIIISAGPVMNLVLGVLCMFVLVTSSVIGGNKLPSNIVAEFYDQEDFTATSCNYGLKVGDEIVSVNGVPTHTGNGLMYEIMNSGFDAVDLTVIRDGEKIKLEDVVFPSFEDEQTEIMFGDMDFKVYAEDGNILNILKHTFCRSASTVKMIWDSVIGLVKGRYGMDTVSGPVGVTKELGNAAKQGGSTFLFLVTVITINLGVFNLFPIPALDGGQLVFLLIEAIRGKPVKQEIMGYVNLIGISALLLLMVVITFKDVIGLF